MPSFPSGGMTRDSLLDGLGDAGLPVRGIDAPLISSLPRTVRTATTGYSWSIGAQGAESGTPSASDDWAFIGGYKSDWNNPALIGVVGRSSLNEGQTEADLAIGFCPTGVSDSSSNYAAIWFCDAEARTANGGTIKTANMDSTKSGGDARWNYWEVYRRGDGTYEFRHDGSVLTGDAADATLSPDSTIATDLHAGLHLYSHDGRYGYAYVAHIINVPGFRLP